MEVYPLDSFHAADTPGDQLQIEDLVNMAVKQVDKRITSLGGI